MGETLLLADDEEGIRRVLGIALADLGFRVLTAADGAEALETFRREKPAIVLTDIKMPGLNGIELLGRIKAERPDTEVIMITGHGDLELAIESLKLEATDFVTKPINDDILGIALKRARDRIAMRGQLKAYTENLEKLVRKQAARLVEAERLAVIGQTVEGLSTAFRDMAGDLEGSVRYFNDMPCFVSVHDRHLTILAANPLHRDRLGEMVGRRSWEIYESRRDRPYTCPVARTIETGLGQRSPEVIRYRDGSQSAVMVHTAPIRDSRGELELVLEFAMDMSEVERLREELQATQDRLMSLGLMVSSVSHGVKGLLTGMDAGIYLAESGLAQGDGERVREGVATVRQMVERIRGVVLDVLYFAKERPLERKAVAVRDFTDGLLAAAGPKIAKRGIGFQTEIAPNLGAFEIDEAVAAPAILNLIENAVDACAESPGRPGHRITFRADGTPHEVLFEVEDDGVGMSPEVQGRIFDLFFSSKGRAGTGLGLFITRQVIAQHGGKISVTSVPGRGSCFRVSLPRRAAPAAPAAADAR
jgi:signal transduction histidine kinase/DNA-binding NarL/FixJ family response regulator